MNTLRELWYYSGESLPFAARFKDWPVNTYAVIIRFGAHFDAKTNKGLLYMERPVGIPITEGRRNLTLINDPVFQEFSVLPQDDKPYWELVKDQNLERFIRQEVLSLDNVMHFGKYLTKEIRDIINNDLRYIFWMIKNQYIVLNEDSVKYILENCSYVDKEAMYLNEQKLIEWKDQNIASKELNLQNESISEKVETSITLQSKMNYETEFIPPPEFNILDMRVWMFGKEHILRDILDHDEDEKPKSKK